MCNMEENRVVTCLENFYNAFYMSDREKMFSYLDTKFKKNIPLNYFLIHSDFDIDIGILQEVVCIEIQKERDKAIVECKLDCERGVKNHIIVLSKEENIWKIEGRSIYMRKGSIR